MRRTARKPSKDSRELLDRDVFERECDRPRAAVECRTAAFDNTHNSRTRVAGLALAEPASLRNRAVAESNPRLGLNQIEELTDAEIVVQGRLLGRSDRTGVVF